MKKLLSIFAISSTLISAALQSTIINNDVKENFSIDTLNYARQNTNRAQEINLSRIKVEDFDTDLGSISDREFDQQDYLEEIKWAMIDSNPDIEDILFDFWDSVLLDYFEQYSFSGINWEVPKKGSSFLTRVRITPDGVPNYKGSLSFKSTFTNNVSQVEEISNLISNTDIGTILDNSEQTLRENVKLKNPNQSVIWNQIMVSDITNTRARLSAIDNSIYYTGSVLINFNIGKHLNDVISQTVLGKINQDINEEVILNQVKIKNSNINTEEALVSKINYEKATALLEAKINSKIYVGEIEVSFIDGIDINIALKNKNLGKVINPDQDSLISLIISKNSNISKKDFTIDQASLSYREVTIIATNESKFFGLTRLEFNGQFNTSITYDSGVQRVDAYNSTQYDGDSKTLESYIGLGKQAFLKTYSEINVNYKKWAYNNHHGDIFNGVEDSVTLKLSTSGSSIVLYQQPYNGSQNWMKLESSISFKWNENYLNLNLNTWVEAYASGWNSQWARAEARTQITSVNFS